MGVDVSVGGTGVAVKVAVGGTGVGVKVWVGGTGVKVKVAVGGIGVHVGVCVSVGGRKGVHDGARVDVIVAVAVVVEVYVAVTVRRLGVGDSPSNVDEGMINGVDVNATVAVEVGVGVILPGSGITTQASQPMQ